MNQNRCQQKQHLSFSIGICTFARCNHEICQACIQDHQQHNQMIKIFQNQGQVQNFGAQNVLLNKPNTFSTSNQINLALKNFDEQFDNSQKELIEFIENQKVNMRNQFEDYIKKDPTALQQCTQGKIQPIQQLFDCINDSLKKQYNEGNIQVDIDFTVYLDKYGIPDFMREQLKKFKFGAGQNDIENVESQELHEEDREKSLIVGQKDQNNQFCGRALIIYKSDPAAIYLGYLKNNKRHGRGILVLNGFQYYLGEFYKNKEWGYGEIQFINKDKLNEKFVGYFSEGKRCGQGQSKILNTVTKQEISFVSINYFNEALHGPRVVQAAPSQKYNFELFQYEKNYFSFKDQWSDKAPLQSINVSTKGITEGQYLQKSPELSIDNSFKEEQQFEEDLNQYLYQNPQPIQSPQNLYPGQFNSNPAQQFPMGVNYLPPQHNFGAQTYANNMNPSSPYQYQQQIYSSQLKYVIFDDINNK
ncbi:hypothetical protein ABPG72_008226 [Tetrahymena utriculariae]